MSEHDDDFPAPDDSGRAERTEEEPLDPMPEGAESAADKTGDEGAAEAEHAEQEGALNEFELNEMIEELCNSKADEFRMLGYEQVTGRDIWDCIVDKYQKKGFPALHQIVNDILSLKSTQFMNWMTMSIYRNAQF